jgi:heme/copper-type cytochrome/quinol oxidase subunit 4
MSRRSCYLLVGVAFALHNGEEALTARRLLRFMQAEAPAVLGDVYAGLTVVDLHASLLILTVLGLVVTAVAVRSSATSAAAFGMMVFAAVLGLNAFLHLGLSIAAWSYMPGVATALLITLPVSALLLRRAKQEAWVSTPAFWAVLPAAVLIHGPALAMFLGASSLLLRE